MLVYSVIASLDGYTADAEGKFDWAEQRRFASGFAYLRYRPRA